MRQSTSGSGSKYACAFPTEQIDDSTNMNACVLKSFELELMASISRYIKSKDESTELIIPAFAYHQDTSFVIFWRRQRYSLLRSVSSDSRGLNTFWHFRLVTIKRTFSHFSLRSHFIMIAFALSSQPVHRPILIGQLYWTTLNWCN